MSVSPSHKKIKSSSNISDDKPDSDEDDLFYAEKHEKIRDFEVLKELGQGSFGSVFLVMKENTKKKYALKVINKDLLSRCEKTEEALVERLILSKCKHPSIIKLSLSFQSSNKLYFVVEYCPNKDLDVLIRKLGIFQKDLALQIIAEIVNVLDYLHNKMFISHNDLKPSNIMLDENYHIKLIDFSTSKVKDKIFDKKKGDFVESEESISKDIIGTAEFVSPEMVNQNIKDYRTNDIWALGIIIYIIFIGKSPFKGKNDFETLNNVKTNQFKIEKNGIPEDVLDLINNILVVDVDKRFDINKIKQHKYFNSINWDTLLNNNVPVDKEKLAEFDRLSKEKNDNEGFWADFCNGINNVSKSKSDFEVNFVKKYPLKINYNFFYKDTISEEQKNKRNCLYEVNLENNEEKGVKFKIFSDNSLEILEIEKKDKCKYIKIDSKESIKLDNENVLILGEEKIILKNKDDANKLYDKINEVIFS